MDTTIKWYEDPIYIKMCEKGWEIQDYLTKPMPNYYLPEHPIVGDVVFIKHPSESRYFRQQKSFLDRSPWTYESHTETRDIVAFVTNTNGYGGGKIGFEDWKGVEVYVPCVQYWFDVGAIIWLPRQDQLQEMVFSVCPKTTLDTFHLLAFMQFAYEGMDLVDSMEQLWLAFVYKENYNKVWYEDDWIAQV